MIEDCDHGSAQLSLSLPGALADFFRAFAVIKLGDLSLLKTLYYGWTTSALTEVDLDSFGIFPTIATILVVASHIVNPIQPHDERRSHKREHSETAYVTHRRRTALYRSPGSRSSVLLC